MVNLAFSTQYTNVTDRQMGSQAGEHSMHVY